MKSTKVRVNKRVENSSDMNNYIDNSENTAEPDETLLNLP